MSLFSSKCWLTQDNFATTRELKVASNLTMVLLYMSSTAFHVQYGYCCRIPLHFCMYILKPSDYLQQSDPTVTLAAFSGGNFVILLESGKVLLFNGTTHSWGDPYGENKRFSFFTSLIKIIDSYV